MLGNINKNKKRDIILEASLKAFSKKGISETSMRDIAKESNIPKGTIYEYFKSKDEIVSEAVFGSVGIPDSVINDIVEKAKSNPISAMDEFIERNAEIVYKDSDKLKLVTQYLIKILFKNKSDVKKVKEDYKQLAVPYIERLKEIIGYGINKGFMKPKEDLEDVCYIVAFILRSFSTFGYSGISKKKLKDLIITVKHSVYYVLGISQSNIRVSEEINIDF